MIYILICELFNGEVISYVIMYFNIDLVIFDFDILICELFDGDIGSGGVVGG